MSYFITIINTNKDILLEEGPYDSISDAMGFLVHNNYFLPPERGSANSCANATIDGDGVAKLYISKWTAGIPYLSKEIKIIYICRDDFFTEKSMEYSGSCTSH